MFFLCEYWWHNTNTEFKMTNETKPTASQINARNLNMIDAAKSYYRVRKYAGAWVPVAIVGGKVFTGSHCMTSGDAMASAIKICASRSKSISTNA
jgi:hypothetical protein